MNHNPTLPELELDPYVCAELLARSEPRAQPEADAGGWASCISCTDPGYDHDEFKWPEKSDDIRSLGVGGETRVLL